MSNHGTWNADKPAYFSAIQAGMAGDYAVMKRLVAIAQVG